jgi:hypothetical protein
VTKIGKAGASNESYISGTNDSDPHVSNSQGIKDVAMALISDVSKEKPRGGDNRQPAWKPILKLPQDEVILTFFCTKGRKQKTLRGMSYCGFVPFLEPPEGRMGFGNVRGNDGTNAY